MRGVANIEQIKSTGRAEKDAVIITEPVSYTHLTLPTKVRV